MRRLGITSVALLALAFTFATAAWCMYRYARATQRICKCEDCEQRYFGSSSQLDPPWAFKDRFMHGGRRLSYPERVFLTAKRDPAGVLPIPAVQVAALLCFVTGVLGAITWLCDSMVAGFGWLLWRLYRWLFALDLAPQARAVVPPESDASSS